jgi:hypothetical protein
MHACALYYQGVCIEPPNDCLCSGAPESAVVTQASKSLQSGGLQSGGLQSRLRDLDPEAHSLQSGGLQSGGLQSGCLQSGGPTILEIDATLQPFALTWRIEGLPLMPLCSRLQLGLED